MIKENRFTTILLIIINIYSLCNFSYTQQYNIDKEFKTAVDLYQSGQYNDALPRFQKIGIQLPYNQKTTIAYLFVGKTYLQLNDLISSKKYLRDFLEKFPVSEYSDEARLALVKVFYKQENYSDAFKEVLHLVSKVKLSGYKTYAESLGQTLAINDLDVYQLETINDTITDLTVKPYLLLLLGQKQESEGNYNIAAEIYQQVMDSYPDSRQREEAQKRLKKQGSKKNEYGSENLMGVLLPLTDSGTGEENAVAKEILEGIKYAVAEYNKNHDKTVGILIRDTENDTLKIKSITDELTTVSAIKAVIGPIFSNEVRATLFDLRNSGIPIISPTATDDDLVDLSDYFFQANPAFIMRAKAMAQYIYFVTGKRKIAVLHAIQGYSPLLASAFSDEFKKLGGEIIDSRNYNSGSFDLINPISAIAADSLNLEGIYVPLSNKMDASPLLSQMVQQRINTSIFGNQDWFYVKGFETSSSLSDQLSFTSDFFIDYNDTLFNTFSKNFSEQTGIDINRNVLYGYDTTEYLLTLIDAGADTRSSLISSMESGIEIKGYHNNISFGKEHINRYLNIVHYTDGKFELTDRFKSGE